MAFSLTWLPTILTEAGLKVALVPGWQTRGRAEMGRVQGVICHFTATASRKNMPTLQLLIDGRSDLPGPLSQLGLARDGTFYVIAAGRCNHAGEGEWRTCRTGNSSFIGIEAENSGAPNDPWPDVQLDAYRRGVAAILRHVGLSAAHCCGHKEWAVPKGRKDDPNLDMEAFRADVTAILNGAAPPPTLIPAAEPGGRKRPTLRRGATGDDVAALQRLLRIDGPPTFGPKTEAAVREFQRQRGAVPDGIVGPATWAALDGAR